MLKALRFPNRTVPAATIDGERVQGTRAIARELERRKPESPLFPDDVQRRRAVEKAERFGDEELQQRVREIFLWAARKDRSGLVGYLEGGKIGMPHQLAARTAGPFIALDARSRGATDENVRRAIADFPGMLQRIDDWIDEGILGGEPPNAADLPIAPSLRLAMSLDDLRPAIEDRPAGRLASRIVKHFPGSTPAVLPPEWLEPSALPRAEQPTRGGARQLTAVRRGFCDDQIAGECRPRWRSLLGHQASHQRASLDGSGGCCSTVSRPS